MKLAANTDHNVSFRYESFLLLHPHSTFLVISKPCIKSWLPPLQREDLHATAIRSHAPEQKSPMTQHSQPLTKKRDRHIDHPNDITSPFSVSVPPLYQERHSITKIPLYLAHLERLTALLFPFSKKNL